MVVLAEMFLGPLNIHGGAMAYFGVSPVAVSCKICALLERPGGVHNERPFGNGKLSFFTRMETT